ncbi:hypothetical protein JQ607_09175 [Bradyrhizobium liaoningense]|nr:hypothetical protein [Bradyrhizobium liaoningense]
MGCPVADLPHQRSSNRLVWNSSSIHAARDHLGPGRGCAAQPMLPALLRGVIFLITLASPFVAALLAR